MNEHVAFRHPSRAAALGVIGAMALALGGCTAPSVEPQGDSIPNRSEEAVADSVETTVATEWIAFTADWPGHDLMLVRAGEPAHQILADDDVARLCPAFEPNGRRLAYGAAAGDEEEGWTDVALGIARVSDHGEASVLDEVALDGFTAPPCPIWSPSGDQIAVGTQPTGPTRQAIVDSIVLVDTETGALRRIDEVDANDFEWSPDGSLLYIAAVSGILVYSVADAELSVIDDTTLGYDLTVSPDGGRLAVERRKINAADRYELWIMGTDGSNASVIAPDYEQVHGIGPVWSPDGDHVVYQRSCVTFTASEQEWPCYEEHEAVVVTVTDGDPTDPLGAERIIEPPRGDDGRPWFPYSVTWSPDSSELLYLGWWMDRESEAYADGLVIAPLDGSDPVMLYETGDGFPAYPWSPMNNFQSWAG